MECLLNGVTLCYEDGMLYKYNKSGSMRGLRGYIRKDGYREVSINNKKYLYHRVIYKCCNNCWDITGYNNNYIDHIDRNKLNNNINNLRVVTATQNQQNTNAKGYGWNKNRNKWQAYICVNYKIIYLGLYLTEEEARNSYLEARKKYNFI